MKATATDGGVREVPTLALRPQQAALAIGVGRRLFAQLLADRTSGLPVVRIGRAVLIPTRELQDWLSARIEGGRQ